jgi:N-acetylglutamate synthase-like GNAT family acetyltransferase
MTVWVRDRFNGEILTDEISETLDYMGKSATGANDRKYLVAEEGGEIIGVVGTRKPNEVMRRFSKTENPIELVNAFVRPDMRKGKGVGSVLVARLEEQARKNDYTEIILNSGPRYESSGWGFYDSVGYERCGVAIQMYGPTGDAQVWRKEL